jgi:lactoylglutathione lyase
MGAPASAQQEVPVSATSDRPFSVLGIQQIAVGALDKSELRRVWIDLLGLTPRGHYRSESENVDEDIAVAGAGVLGVEVDLMQPIDAEKSPKVHSPALNHVGLWIDDLPAAVEWLGARGVRFTPGGIRRGAAGFDVCFVHPKGNEAAPIGGAGVLIELVQAPDEVVEAIWPGRVVWRGEARPPGRAPAGSSAQTSESETPAAARLLMLTPSRRRFRHRVDGRIIGL